MEIWAGEYEDAQKLDIPAKWLESQELAEEFCMIYNINRVRFDTAYVCE